MYIKAQVIADSTSWLNKRLTTLILEYPRYIHAELLTHRVFSKNSASSRAIPFSKIIKSVLDNPAKPIWTGIQKGMQGPIIEDSSITKMADSIWAEALGSSIIHATDLVALGVHKQNVNRLLEPWYNIKVILTGTEFDNFFELRNHKDAQPEIQALAKAMYEAMSESTPKLLQPGEWHLPFADKLPITIGLRDDTIAIHGSDLEVIKRKVIAARCARISYDNVDGTNATIEKDLDLFDKLVTSLPRHLSPTEHLARVPDFSELQHFLSKWRYTVVGAKPEYKAGKYFSNLIGWIQYRKLLENGEA